MINQNDNEITQDCLDSIDDASGAIANHIIKTLTSLYPEKNIEIPLIQRNLARLFVECFKRFSVYVPTVNSWYKYNGKNWEIDTGNVYVDDCLDTFFDGLRYYSNQIEDDNAKQNFFKFITANESRKKRNDILQDARFLNCVESRQFDNDPYLINLQNGTFNLKTNTLMPHNYKDYLTKITNCSYFEKSEETTSFKWQKFINDVMMNNTEQIQSLQKALGYSLLGIPKEECMFIIYGNTTRNGKSTLINTITHTLGTYAKTISAGAILQGGTNTDYTRANPLIAQLKGIRLCAMNESKDSAKFEETTIKSLTGNDPITVRDMYSKPFTYNPEFTIWLSCNSLPLIEDVTLFASDRIRLFEFKRHFKREEQDKNLKEKLRHPSVLQEIFQWLIKGYQAYLETGLNFTTEEIKLINQYYLESDPMLSFKEEKIKANAENKVKRVDMYNAYVLHCRQLDKKPKSSAKLYKYLDGYYEQSKIKGERYYKHIEIEE